MKVNIIDRAEQAELDYGMGYADRWGKLPFNEDASDGWKRGWKEANSEITGDRDAEFTGCVPISRRAVRRGLTAREL
jgi:hypothetical protein